MTLSKLTNLVQTDNTRRHMGLIVTILVVLTFLASLLTTNNVWKNGISKTDSSVFLYVGKMITKGYIPYRDTFDHKGPLLYLINAVGYSISPQKGIWFIELIFLFGTVLYIYKIASLFVDDKKSLIVTIVCIAQLSYFFEGGNLTEEYAMPFIAYSLYVFIDYFKNNNVTKVRLIMTGLSFMAVCFLRANMISVWVVFCLAVLVQCILKRNFKSLGYFILFFLIGAAILAIPILLWLYLNGAINDFLETYLEFNLLYSRDPELGGIEKIIVSLITFYEYPIITVAFAVAVFVFLKDYKKLDFLYLCFLVVLMVLMCMSGRTYPHYGMILIPSLVYPMARISESLQMANMKHYSSAFLGLSFMLILPCLARYGYSTVLNRNYSEQDKAILNICKTIDRDTNEDEKIIVNGNTNSIYLLSNRDSLSKYSYQFPVARISSDIANQYYADLKTREAKVIVMSEQDWNYEDIKVLVEGLGYHMVTEEAVDDEKNPYSFYIYELK